MTVVTLCGRLGDPEVAKCREALQKEGIHISFRPYYGSQYSPHEFPIVTHGSISYHSMKEVNEFLEKYRARERVREETKVITKSDSRRE